MKAFIIVVLFAFPGLGLLAQDEQHKLLDELGWEISNFNFPQLTDLDTGYVDYLVSLSRNGKVLRIKVLHNTFDKSAEKLWRMWIKNSSFNRTSPTDARKNEGRFSIERRRCPSTPSTSSGTEGMRVEGIGDQG